MKPSPHKNPVSPWDWWWKLCKNVIGHCKHIVWTCLNNTAYPTTSHIIYIYIFEKNGKWTQKSNPIGNGWKENVRWTIGFIRLHSWRKDLVRMETRIMNIIRLIAATIYPTYLETKNTSLTFKWCIFVSEQKKISNSNLIPTSKFWIFTPPKFNIDP